MGLASANETPRQEGGKKEVRLDTPTTPTPTNFLDIRKPPLGATSVKDHERIVDDLRKENFDLKLKLYNVEEQLRRFNGTRLENILEQNEELKAKNEALITEVAGLKGILQEASSDIEMARRHQFAQSDQTAEIERLQHELQMSQAQFTRSVQQLKNCEEQLEIFDKESIETTKKIRQLELDLVDSHKKCQEAEKIIGNLKEESTELQEELQSKNVFVQQVKTECQTLQAELQTLLHAKQEAENRARIAENERDQIRNEADPARRRMIENVIAQAPGSPRSSLDLIESRLMKQVGDASKQIELMSKSQALSQTEREALQETTRKLSAEINTASRSLLRILERMSLITGIQPNRDIVNNDHVLGLDRLVDDINRMIEVVLGEFDEIRRQNTTFGQELKDAHDEIATLMHNNEKAREQAREATQLVEQVERDSESVRVELQKVKSEYFRLEQQYKAAAGTELPKYREQCVTLQSAVQTLERELVARDKRLSDVKLEAESLRRKCNESEQEIARVTADASMIQEEMIELRRQKNEVIERLARQEESVAQTTFLLDEKKQSLAQAERVRAALQENFNKEIRELHNSNAELKAQVAAATSGRNSNDQRVERLQASLKFVEQSNEELISKLQSKETAYSAILREHEVLIVEKQNIERQLHAVQEEARKSELELSRLKRQEFTARRGHEGLEHLQAKVESLTVLNGYLKEQVEAKEKSLREAEERLRRQDDEIRHAYSDCATQHQKIKKREMVISRVLKRLENINAVAGLGNVLEDMASGLPDSPTKNARF